MLRKSHARQWTLACVGRRRKRRRRAGGNGKESTFYGFPDIPSPILLFLAKTNKESLWRKHGQGSPMGNKKNSKCTQNDNGTNFFIHSPLFSPFLGVYIFLLECISSGIDESMRYHSPIFELICLFFFFRTPPRPPARPSTARRPPRPPRRRRGRGCRRG